MVIENCISRLRWKIVQFRIEDSQSLSDFNAFKGKHRIEHTFPSLTYCRTHFHFLYKVCFILDACALSLTFQNASLLTFGIISALLSKSVSSLLPFHSHFYVLLFQFQKPLRALISITCTTCNLFPSYWLLSFLLYMQLKWISTSRGEGRQSRRGWWS